MPSLLLPRYLLPAMSDKKSPPRKEKPIIVRTPHSDDKVMKRKLLSPGSPTHDEDDKRTPAKRKRGSFSLETSPVPGHLTSGPKTPGSGSRSVPLSERQQLAMIMRMSDERQQGGLHVPEKEPIGKPPSPNPHVQPAVRRTPLDKKVHKRNERGELPIHLAAIRGDAKLLKRLIKAGSDVNVADYAGWTPLHEASNRGWMSVARQLLKAGADVNCRGLENDTPLHDAAINGHKKVVELLLKNGANPRQANAKGKTPLDVAASQEMVRLLRKEVVELLLKHGANPRQANAKGKTPLDVAASQEMVRLLRKEVHSSGSDTSSLEDGRSPPLSPTDSIISKDDDRGLDMEDSDKFPNNQKLSMPKSPSDGKLTSPRLCLKFQRDVNLATAQRSQGSKEPQYKSYSVTSISASAGQLGAESSGGEMFTPVTSPASSMDSTDLYHHPGPGTGGGLHDRLQQHISGNQNQPSGAEEDGSRLSAPEGRSRHSSQEDGSRLSSQDGSQHGSHTEKLDQLPLIQFDEEDSNKAMELYPGQALNNSHGNNDKVFTMSLGRTGSVGSADKARMRTCESQSFVPNLNWSESQRDDSSSLPDIEQPAQHIPSSATTCETVSPAATDDSQCNSVSSTGVGEGPGRGEGLQNQAVVTSTTGSNNLPLTAGAPDRDTCAPARGATGADKEASDPSRSSSDSVNSVSVAAATAQNSHVTSLKWDLRSASSPRSDDGSVHSNKSDPLRTNSPSRSSSDKESKDKSSRPSSPKVPPLKIIIPTKPQASSSSDSNDRLKLLVTNVKSAHPYVINPYQDPSREGADCLPCDENLARTLNSIPSSHIQSSPSLLNQSQFSDILMRLDNNKTSGDDSSKCADLNSVLDGELKPQSKLSDKNSDSDSSRKDDKRDEVTPRVLRSSVRSQQQSDTRPVKPGKQQDRPDRLSNNVECSYSEAAASSSSAAPSSSSLCVTTTITTATVTSTFMTTTTMTRSGALRDQDEDLSSIHPRKRKIKAKSDPSQQSDSPTPPTTGAQTQPGSGSGLILEKVPNPYDLFLQLRKKIVSRRQSLVNICPKIPQGFKDYLMRTCNYVLQGNTTSTLSVPTLSPPNSVTDKMRDLFVQQEEGRYKLRLQHLIEREKLILSMEQEMLREHGRAARALVNQGTPLSVCTVLRDEEIYNLHNTIQTPMEEKDKKNRTRYNGRQFLSWLQDVDDKYEKIKELLILRQKQEADSLFAIQKLEWEWRLKELGLCDRNASPDIDDLHVPLVHVTDNFDLLPT